MTVETAIAEYRSFHDGRAYYFCSAGCKLSIRVDHPTTRLEIEKRQFRSAPTS